MKWSAMRYFVLILAFSLQAEARLFCAGLFSENKFFIENLQQKKIPAAEVKVGNKEMLVVLGNQASLPELESIYKHSLGIVVNHQTGYNNDHGMLRLGDYFIDRDAPGARRDGEINSTGISWAGVKGYVDYAARAQKSYNRVEVLFDLNSKEMRTALIYQKMRRAGVIRPDFVFNGARNPDANNRLEGCGEICFSFSTGAGVDQQIRAVEQKLKALSIPDPQEFIHEPEIAAYLHKLTDYLLEAKLDAGNLSPSLSANILKPGWLARVLGKKITKPAALRDFEVDDINWLLGYKVSVDYSALLKTLGITNSNSFSNVNAARASAVVIYDAKVSAENFLSDHYTSVGVFSTWKNQEVKALQDAR